MMVMSVTIIATAAKVVVAVVVVVVTILIFKHHTFEMMVARAGSLFKCPLLLC
jgi:hypothetical protein